MLGLDLAEEVDCGPRFVAGFAGIQHVLHSGEFQLQ